MFKTREEVKQIRKLRFSFSLPFPLSENVYFARVPARIPFTAAYLAGKSTIGLLLLLRSSWRKFLLVERMRVLFGIWILFQVRSFDSVIAFFAFGFALLLLLDSIDKVLLALLPLLSETMFQHYLNTENYIHTFTQMNNLYASMISEHN
ncbi:hypothetical protein CKAN_01205200 [Cinnamomum micranthum f. kanehirae]|uniref:Uncharacterized protein n=1 Tax=Cinnamomum micranthum f. kanehirae TaxID=337451 RepID=A0A443NXN3_9MAGN|nr:hypothetical protein CKAN_01205200 [Cinnamomum micranthum f. kanehirae]